MTTTQEFDPLHVALKYIAAICIDEDMLEEAETMARFLDLVKVAPRTVGLLRVWLLSQKGELEQAQTLCQELEQRHPEADEFQPLLAVLSFANSDPRWRNVCDSLVASTTASSSNRALAQSLLDGSFADKKDAKAGETPAAAPAATTMDYAAMAAFMRA